MAAARLLGRDIIRIMRIDGHVVRNPVGYGNTRHFQPFDLCRIVGQKTHLSDLESATHSRGHSVIAFVVGETEADVKQGRVSLTSPIARALIGKKAGDTIEVKTPGGAKSYEILKVVFI